jgi:hypothetical protein
MVAARKRDGRPQEVCRPDGALKIVAYVSTTMPRLRRF